MKIINYFVFHSSSIWHARPIVLLPIVFITNAFYRHCIVETGKHYYCNIRCPNCRNPDIMPHDHQLPNPEEYLKELFNSFQQIPLTSTQKKKPKDENGVEFNASDFDILFTEDANVNNQNAPPIQLNNNPLNDMNQEKANPSQSRNQFQSFSNDVNMMSEVI